jgi:hypothetical protein
MIGGDVDLDLLSLFPQKDSTSMGGIERRASFPRSTMKGERGGKRAQRIGDCWGRSPLK